MPLYRQGSARLGAGAAANGANGASQSPTAGAAAPSSAASGLGDLTAGSGAAQRGAGAIRRSGQGLGRRAENAARSFYVTDDRYTRNTGDPNSYDKAEDPKVYSNDPGEAARGPIALSQAVPAYVPPPTTDAPVLQQAQPKPALLAPPPAPAAPAATAPAVPVMNIGASNPGQVRSEAGVTAPTNPVAGVRSDLTSGNLSGRLDQPTAAAPAGQTPTQTVGSVRTDLTSGNLSGRLDSAPAPAPAPTMLQAPNVAGFLQAQKRNLGR